MLHLSLAGAFAILFVGAIPGVASAHAFLISSSPPAGARLGTAPGVVTLRYSEAVQPGLSQASVIDPTGHRFTGTVSATSITIPLATNAPGTYRVGWKVVAADDGHTTHGTFEFSVVSAGAAAGGQAGPGATGFLASVFRAVQYAALLAAIGMLLLSSLARRDPPVPWVRPRLRIALAVLLAAGAATAAVDALSASSSLAGAGRYVVSTSPGVARLAAVALEVLALGAAVVGAPVWPALGAAAVAIAASGHPAHVHPAWWGISVDAAHLAAAGLWAGAIMALATIRAPGGWRGEEGRRLLDRFSPVALAAFGTTVALGVVQALVFLPSL
ncbi:MAG TPA: copper resistance CopC family protein, partial [Actinomycetota bacterium]|nr:copper resistance CopC family protein [Actinomycetota bacterium]